MMSKSLEEFSFMEQLRLLQNRSNIHEKGSHILIDGVESRVYKQATIKLDSTVKTPELESGRQTANCDSEKSENA